MTETFLKTLRDRARVSRDADECLDLKAAADDLSGAIDSLHNEPTHENLMMVNSLWARAERLYKQSDDGTSDDGGGAGMPVPQERLVA